MNNKTFNKILFAIHSVHTGKLHLFIFLFYYAVKILKNFLKKCPLRVLKRLYLFYFYKHLTCQFLMYCCKVFHFTNRTK